MRLIKISAPRGEAADIVKLAFDAGIKSASVYQVENHSASGETKIKDTIDVETSTPKGKSFIDSLLAAEFYNPNDYSIAVRQPRSIISGESIRELTKPLLVWSLFCSRLSGNDRRKRNYKPRNFIFRNYFNDYRRFSGNIRFSRRSE